jgi:hypothetical protein
MYTLFTVGFAAIFLGFVLAAIVGHVLLVTALVRPNFRHIGLRKPESPPEEQPAAATLSPVPHNESGKTNGRLEPGIPNSPFPASLLFGSKSKHLADRAPTH